MPSVFAIITVQTPIVEAGKVVGHNNGEIRKSFAETVKLGDVHKWARDQKAHGCMLMFETQTSGK